MRIDSYSFGSITIDGRLYDKDVVIAHGQVHSPWWRQAGGHVFAPIAGHQVRTAASIALASTAIHGWLPDLALLDISLPDGNSLDFLEAHQESFSSVVVVIMTAVQETGALERATRLGAVDILIKPFPHTAILELVDRCVGQEQPALA